MRRKAAVFALIASFVLLGSVSPAHAENATLFTDMTGAAERPGPGDPDAFGRARLYINDDNNTLCLAAGWTKVDGTLSGLHVHLAPPTSPGPVVIPFAVPPPGSSSTYQCVVVANEALLDNVAANPQQYYINLHSTPNFAPGAIRGQLRRVA